MTHLEELGPCVAIKYAAGRRVFRRRCGRADSQVIRRGNPPCAVADVIILVDHLSTTDTRADTDADAASEPCFCTGPVR